MPKAKSATKVATKAAIKPKQSKASASARPAAPTRAQTESLYEAVCMLLKILTVGEDVFAPAGGKIKYNGTDFQAIAFIGRNPGCMASDISQFLAVPATTTTSTLDRLVKLDLVSRTRPESNRRAVALSLTAQGEETFEAMVTHDMRSMKLMLEVLMPEERDAFIEQIGRISNHFIALQAASKSE
jgi:DNA-binding MarR family transcriptional regulator